MNTHETHTDTEGGPARKTQTEKETRTRTDMLILEDIGLRQLRPEQMVMERARSLPGPVPRCISRMSENGTQVERKSIKIHKILSKSVKMIKIQAVTLWLKCPHKVSESFV